MTGAFREIAQTYTLMVPWKRSAAIKCGSF
jgi:hypothetical protein